MANYSRRNLRERLALVSAVGFYAAIFHWTLLTVVIPIFGSWGFADTSPSIWYLAIAYILCIVPALWMPTDFERPSLLLFYVQYFFIFVPSTFVAFYSTRPQLTQLDALLLILTMFVGVSVIEFIYLLPRARFSRLSLTPGFFWSSFAVAMVGLMGYVIAIFGNNFRFADLTGIYDVRAAMADIVVASGTRLGLYAQAWLAGFFLPVCFAVAAFAHKRWLFFVVGLGYSILFGVAGAKSTLFSVVFLTLIWTLLSHVRRNVAAVFIVGLSSLLVTGAVLENISSPLFVRWYVAIVQFRMLALPGSLLVEYVTFFKTHAVTHFSHVTGIASLFTYPYNTDLGHLIGLYYFGVPVDANAGLWATDGAAAFGQLGILLASMICAGVFWLFDSLARPYDARVVAVAVTFVATSFGNASLATVLVTGGFGLLLVTLILLPRSGRVASSYLTSNALSYSGARQTA